MPVVGQPTPQEAARAGAGSAAPNPWAEFGLNPDGSPLEEAQPKPDGDKSGVEAENAALKSKVADLESKLSRIPDDFEGVTKKLGLLDKLVNTLRGDADESGDGEKLQAIYKDLKTVAKRGNPGLAKLLDLLETDPDVIDKLGKGVGVLTATHLTALNERAHDMVMGLAKKQGMKAENDAELAKMVLPFEQSITLMINADPELKRAFVSGDLRVVEQAFNGLFKPHLQQRLREKAARSNASGGPKAPPKGGAAPGSGGDGRPVKPDLSNPRARADFVKGAIGRWLDKSANKSEE